jgi:hypothetical protein
MFSWLDIRFRTIDRQDDYYESDLLIKPWLDHNKEFERYIFTRIAGVSFPNLDGTSRQDALRSCKPLDRLFLHWEIENPVSRTAISVSLENGQQLGYLESCLGKETFRRVQKGEQWIGFIVQVGQAREYLGATIVIVKLRRRVKHAA